MSIFPGFSSFNESTPKQTDWSATLANEGDKVQITLRSSSAKLKCALPPPLSIF